MAFGGARKGLTEMIVSPEAGVSVVAGDGSRAYG